MPKNKPYEKLIPTIPLKYLGKNSMGETVNKRRVHQVKRGGAVGHNYSWGKNLIL